MFFALLLTFALFVGFVGYNLVWFVIRPAFNVCLLFTWALQAILISYVIAFDKVEHHLPDVHTYADDTQLYVSFSADSGSEQSAALGAMQSCIVDIRNWMLQDRLKLNDDKTEFIVIGTRQQLAKVNVDSLQVGESIVYSNQQSNKFRLLVR